VVEEAARLADEVGWDRLTLAALAKRLGIATPSLYKHVEGLDALLGEVALLSIHELTETMRDAAVGRAGPDALRSVCHAYRGYVHEHPGRYAATVRAARDDEALAAQRRGAAQEAAEVVFAVLRGYGLDDTSCVDATRALRSALHGFTSIEAAEGFGLDRDVDSSFEAMVGALDRALRSWGDRDA
jgi:AcrR family transcriptional regulator